MIEDMRQALETNGYTADEIELLLKSFVELRDKLRNAVASSTVHKRSRKTLA